jgi:hypothetical protein
MWLEVSMAEVMDLTETSQQIIAVQEAEVEPTFVLAELHLQIA